MAATKDIDVRLTDPSNSVCLAVMSSGLAPLAAALGAGEQPHFVGTARLLNHLGRAPVAVTTLSRTTLLPSQWHPALPFPLTPTCPIAPRFLYATHPRVTLRVHQ